MCVDGVHAERVNLDLREPPDASVDPRAKASERARINIPRRPTKAVLKPARPQAFACTDLCRLSRKYELRLRVQGFNIARPTTATGSARIWS